MSSWTWIWIVFSIALVLIGLRAARQNFRRDLRARLRPRLEAAGFQIERETEAEFVLRRSDGEEATWFLHNVYLDAAQAGKDQEAVLDRYLNALKEAGQGTELSPTDQARLMPRLMHAAAYADMLASGKTELVSQRLGQTPLQVMLVIDHENSVAYLHKDQLDPLGLKEHEAFDLAKANLRKSWQADKIRESLNSRTLLVIKTLDSYDAARLLLVPELLHEGESVAALVPDRDSLLLTQPPEDGNWSGLERLAADGGDRPIFDQPLLVTRDGIFERPAKGSLSA